MAFKRRVGKPALRYAPVALLIPSILSIHVQFPIYAHLWLHPQLERLLARAHLLSDSVQFIIEHVAETLGKDEGEDVVLVFRRVLGSANGAGRVPDPGFEGFRRRFLGHEIEGIGVSEKKLRNLRKP